MEVHSIYRLQPKLESSSLGFGPGFGISRSKAHNFVETTSESKQ